MTRFLFTLALFVSFTHVNAQDTIVFKDGYVWLAKVIAVSEDKINFIRKRDKVESAQISAVEEYTFEGAWYSGKDKSPQSGSKTNLKPSIFSRKAAYTYGKFSLLLNPALPMIDVNYDYWSSGNYYYYPKEGRMFSQTNRTLGIEFEYRLADRFSLKAPLIVALESTRPSQLVFVGSESPLFQVNTFGDFTSSAPTTSISNSVTINPRRNSALPVGHAREVIFQTGIVPKIYLLGQNKLAVYLSAGAFVGIVNDFQIDHYLDFIWAQQVNFGEVSYQPQVIIDNVNRTSDPKVFFKSELMVGMEFNISKGLNFGIEEAFSTKLFFNNAVDNYYGRYNADPYEKLSAGHVSSYNFLVFPLSRVYLIYRFGGQKITN